MMMRLLLFTHRNYSSVITNNRFILPIINSRKSSSTTTSQPQINNQTVVEITSILKNRNWPQILNSSPNLLKNLNPDVIQQSQRLDPNRLLHFFNWLVHQFGTNFQTLKSFLIVYTLLCNSNQSRHASVVLGQMIDTRKTVSVILDAIDGFCVEGEGLRYKSIIYGMVIDGYKNKGMLNEAVCVVLGVKIREHFPDLGCVNSLMTNLLKCQKNEFVWMVYDKMLELRIVPDVYLYTNLISALCKEGKVVETKRVFVEMGENGCDPSLVTYNVFIGGLCRGGVMDEAFEVKRLMTKKGFVPNRYTYTTLIDGLCKMKKLEEAKTVLEDMSKVVVFPDHSYRSIFRLKNK